MDELAWRKTVRISLGVGLVILGIIGGLLPILQGWMFMIPGLIILSEYFPGIKKLLDWAKRKAGLDKDKEERPSPHHGAASGSAGGSFSL